MHAKDLLSTATPVPAGPVQPCTGPNLQGFSARGVAFPPRYTKVSARVTLWGMRLSSLTVLFGLVLSCAIQAQSAQAQSARTESAQLRNLCSPGSLPNAARNVAVVRHELHGVAVGELDPVVPAAVATQLLRLKDALSQAAAAAMACSSSSATAESLQDTLATALHANLSHAEETVLVTPAHKDLGAYGSDLQVQVLPLSNVPMTLEIDFRYGVECGDDNLLLIYRRNTTAAGEWKEVLRWDAPAYRNVGDAFGDFVLLTPLVGLPNSPNWRAAVAHGHPGCSTTDRSSRFDLDLLQPTADPAHPAVAWHLEQPYRRGDTPRLATTEDSLSFEMVPPESENQKAGKNAGGQPTAGTSAGPGSPSVIYRYRFKADNQVHTIGAAPEALPSAAQPETSQSRTGQTASSTNSPQ